ncbi:MAG: hypothetical protein AAGC55_14695, partial [Myxococcota bacterium]
MTRARHSQMRCRLLGAAVAAVVGLAGAPPSWACATSAEYVQPSNYELVKTTGIIVLARAVSEAGPADDPKSRTAAQSDAADDQDGSRERLDDVAFEAVEILKLSKLGPGESLRP